MLSALLIKLPTSTDDGFFQAVSAVFANQQITEFFQIVLGFAGGGLVIIFILAFLMKK